MTHVNMWRRRRVGPAPGGQNLTLLPSFGSCVQFFTSLGPENVVKERRRQSGSANVAANALNLFMWKYA